jgi:hypothetical protein
MNALHYAFRASSREDNRLLLTLQVLAWMNLFRKCIIQGKHLVTPTDITALTGPEPLEKPEAVIDQILAMRTDKPHEASQLAFAFAHRHRPELLLSAARRLLPVKSSGNPHDIKYPDSARGLAPVSTAFAQGPQVGGLRGGSDLTLARHSNCFMARSRAGSVADSLTKVS